MGIVKTHSGSERFRVETPEEQNVVWYIIEEKCFGRLDKFYNEFLGYNVNKLGIHEDIASLLAGERKKTGDMRTMPLERWENMQKIFDKDNKNQKYESKHVKQRKPLETLDQAAYSLSEISKLA
jgi:hypothetical protein